MRIFVTGASGWIGSAVVPELLGAGHEVVGLARSEPSAERLEDAGALVHRGDLDDPDDLAKAAADSDGVIHLAFQHEVAFGGNFAAAGAADRRAVEAMGAALAGSDRPLVLASGMLGLAMGRAATEEDGLVPDAVIRANPAGIRAATALLALSLRGTGVRSSVLRLPPTVHGDGDNGFMATLIGIARARRGRIRRGREQPLAGGASFRRRQTVPSRRRSGPGRLRVARGRRRRCCVPRHRRRNGSAPRRPHGVGGTRRRGRALRAPRSLRRAGQPGHGRRHQGAARVGAHRALAARGPGAGPLLPRGVIPGLASRRLEFGHRGGLGVFR